MQGRLPRVTFGIIVLNGEPFVRYNLRALYPFAHQIIVVEGAVSSAACIATQDGHSTDGTRETLARFKDEEDPENKLLIVTKETFWHEKKEQSQAFAQRATGDYLWIVDIDEFYHADDMRTVLGMLQAHPNISAVFFKQIAFWGGFDYVTDGWYLRQRQGTGPGTVQRISKWGPGFSYASHRPIVIEDPDGLDVARDKSLDGTTLARQGLFMYHYSLLFPRQVREKSEYYSRADWANAPRMADWAEETYTRLRSPYRVHNVYRYPSWLARFEGRHPDQIEALREDISSGRVSETMRPTDDIESLLHSRRYRAGRLVIKALDPFARFTIRQRRRIKKMLTGS
jgi:hypothetical protein